MQIRGRIPASITCLALALSATGQNTFVSTPSQIPSGSMFNSGFTENVDFADVDGDGDFDISKAEGGDSGNQQSRLWINRGGELGGTIGFFEDRTATQFPIAQFTSRDLDFADIDGDGDLDAHLSNTSSAALQSARWWINMGGAQGGTQGFFQDQTATRWVDLSSPGSSLWPNLVLGSGGFTDWSNDSDFGDLDNDGDLDLVHSSGGDSMSGQVPTRLFLNTAGTFREFNPSGFQLTGVNIADGNPALWALGTQLHETTNNAGFQSDIAACTIGLELGDIDGDLDQDLLLGDRNTRPRMFRNLLVESGGVLSPWRDVTTTVFMPGYAPGQGHYEQEFGDCDNDDDIDIYGVNWKITAGSFNDATYPNDGAGNFGAPVVLPNSQADDNEADFLDYDNDGDLDVYVAAYAQQDRLYRNDFAGAGHVWVNVTSTEVPIASYRSLDADCLDLDADGDSDALLAQDSDQPERLLINIRNNADTYAPRLKHLEQAPNRVASATPTVIRVHQYDNQAYYGTWFNSAALRYRVNGGPYASAPLLSSGGANLFRGELPGNLVGTVEYFARSVDIHGNVGESGRRSFVATCAANSAGYCTAGTSTNGCVPVLSASGTASATAASGFVAQLTGVEGQKQGLFFYGLSGRNAVPWGAGSSSFLCLTFPTQRTPTQTSTGTPNACDGTFALDWNAYRASHPTALGQPFAAGDVVNLQVWYRDPPAPKTTNLSAAIEFIVCQ